jgi:hypothetical protein
MFVLLAACVIVWPTQWISDRANLWLRVAAIVLTALQAIVGGPRLQLLPAYLIAVLFLILLLANRNDGVEPSAIRESEESSIKTIVRWSMVLGTAGLLIVAIVLELFRPM